MTPGMHVSVVKAYSADSESVPVNSVSSVDLPTDGNPVVYRSGTTAENARTNRLRQLNRHRNGRQQNLLTVHLLPETQDLNSLDKRHPYLGWFLKFFSKLGLFCLELTQMIFCCLRTVRQLRERPTADGQRSTLFFCVRLISSSISFNLQSGASRVMPLEIGIECTSPLFPLRDVANGV